MSKSRRKYINDTDFEQYYTLYASRYLDREIPDEILQTIELAMSFMFYKGTAGFLEGLGVARRIKLIDCWEISWRDHTLFLEKDEITWVIEFRGCKERGWEVDICRYWKEEDFK